MATKAVPTVVTGVVGAAAFEVLTKAPWRKATVGAAALGLRAARSAEHATKVSAERARLAVADVFAEATDRAGGRVSPPAAAGATPAAAAKAGDACH